jgi:DNA-binding MarR family transcriptional regulator
MARSRKSERIRSLERALHRVGDAERRLRQAAAGNLGINATDLDTLLLLDEHGAMTAGRLAEALAITTGAVTGLVDRLARAGWVERARHEADRRQVLVELASARRAAIDAHRELRERCLTQALGTVGDEALSATIEQVEKAAQGLLQGAAEISQRAGTSEDAESTEEGSRAPIGSASRGHLRIVAGVSRLELEGARIRDLYRAHFEGKQPQVRVTNDGTVALQYKGFSWFGSRGVRARLTLTSAVPWNIEIRGGVSELHADLRELEIEAIDIAGGASSSELRLPAPRGTAHLRMTGGANHVVVRRPKGVAAQAIVRGGANSLAFDKQHVGSLGTTTRFATPGYEAATNRWSIELTGGASDLSVAEE